MGRKEFPSKCPAWLAGNVPRIPGARSVGGLARLAGDLGCALPRSIGGLARLAGDLGCALPRSTRTEMQWELYDVEVLE